MSITVGKLYRKWRRVREADNLEAYARGVLVNAWLDELAGFPAYLKGTRVIAAQSANLADRTLTLTFTPSSSGPVLWTRCDTRLLNDSNLEPLPDPHTAGVLVEARADSDDPNRPVEANFVWEDALGGCGATQLELDSQTPGRLRVLVNGVEVGDGTWWDYEQRGQVTTDLSRVCDGFEDGQLDTVRVEPEHMTGDWRVLLTRRGR